MRAWEFISENSDNDFEKNIDIDSRFGGGKIQIRFKKTQNILNYIHSIYFNSSGKELFKYVVQNKKQTWYDESNPNGQLFHENTSPNELFRKFFNSCAKIMFERFGQNLLKDDPLGKRTLELTKKLGQNVMENADHSDIKKEIYTNLKPAMDLLSWGIENIDKEITNWPDLITESKKPDLPDTYVLTDVKNNDAYEILRLGVAIAGARGKENISASSDVGENVAIFSYGEDTGKLIDKALNQIGKRGKVKKGGAKKEKSENVKGLLPQFRSW